MTPGSDGKTIDGMSVDRIGHLIAALKDESYMPTPARRVYIPKRMGRKDHWASHQSKTRWCKRSSDLFLKLSMRDILRIPRTDLDQEEAVIRLCVPSKLFHWCELVHRRWHQRILRQHRPPYSDWNSSWAHIRWKISSTDMEIPKGWIYRRFYISQDVFGNSPRRDNKPYLGKYLPW